jgi:hypothetical protein
MAVIDVRISRNNSMFRKTFYSFIDCHISKNRGNKLSHGLTFKKWNLGISFDMKPTSLETLKSYDGRETLTYVLKQLTELCWITSEVNVECGNIRRVPSALSASLLRKIWQIWNGILLRKHIISDDHRQNIIVGLYSSIYRTVKVKRHFDKWNIVLKKKRQIEHY